MSRDMRGHYNNDGMDPDWKPAKSQEAILRELLQEAESKLSSAEQERDNYRATAKGLLAERDKLWAENEALGSRLSSALDRMDRARRILTDGKPTPGNNWGILDTSDLRATAVEELTPAERFHVAANDYLAGNEKAFEEMAEAGQAAEAAKFKAGYRSGSVADPVVEKPLPADERVTCRHCGAPVPCRMC